MLGGLFGKKRRERQVDPQICMVALSGAEPPTREAVEQAFGECFPEISIERMEGEDSAPGFVVGGYAVMFMHMPVPIPRGDVDSAVERSWMWPAAKDEMARHRSHVLVATTGEGIARESAWAASRIAAAVCRACNAVGVYWGNGGHVHEPQFFVELARDVDAPVPLWVGLVISAKTEQGPFSLSSRGMSALGHMELEIIDTSLQPTDLADAAYSLVAYLVENGPVLEHGHTFGPDTETKWRVEHVKSVFRRGERVLRLQMP